MTDNTRQTPASLKYASPDILTQAPPRPPRTWLTRHQSTALSEPVVAPGLAANQVLFKLQLKRLLLPVSAAKGKHVKVSSTIDMPGVVAVVHSTQIELALAMSVQPTPSNHNALFSQGSVYRKALTQSHGQ